MTVHINADDLGLSPGINKAIYEGYQRGLLDSASMMVNAPYFEEAVDLFRGADFAIGLHFNLLYYQAVETRLNHLVDQERRFKESFPRLLLACYGVNRKQVLAEVTLELEAQLQRLKAVGIKVAHIDSHLHTHMIPPIHGIVREAARRNQIERVRVATENPFRTLALTRGYQDLFSLNLLKLLLLNYLGFCSGAEKERSSFFSILHTCRVKPEYISAILNQGHDVEVMLHPGYPELDRKMIPREDSQYKDMLADYRNIERMESIVRSVASESDPA